MSGVATCKLTLVGNGSVGKTSICQRFRADGFQPVYRQTVGVDFLEKRLEVRWGWAARVASFRTPLLHDPLAVPPPFTRLHSCARLVCGGAGLCVPEQAGGCG